MPKGKPISKSLAATALALRDVGKSQGEVAKELGVSQQVVSNIERGEGEWGKIHGEVWFDAYRKKIQRKHEAMLHELSTAALERMSELIDCSPLRDVAMTFGVLQDKARLLAGQSTQNVSHSVRVEDEKLSKMLDVLTKSLAVDAAREIQAEAVEVEANEGESNTSL